MANARIERLTPTKKTIRYFDMAINQAKHGVKTEMAIQHHNGPSASSASKHNSSRSIDRISAKSRALAASTKSRSIIEKLKRFGIGFGIQVSCLNRKPISRKNKLTAKTGSRTANKITPLNTILDSLPVENRSEKTLARTIERLARTPRLR